MISEKIRVEKYFNTGSKKYSFWIFMGSSEIASVTKKEKKEFIKFAELNLGPIGQKWHYQRLDSGRFILKLNSETDAVFFLLKFKRD
jgi:hypothetical protein